jgi:uncharacterized membrane protein YeaQ/YmgE (transglycosylase-associated protein family)
MKVLRRPVEFALPNVRQMGLPPLMSIGLGLLGALVGYLIFTVGLGIGDTNIFDWGGVLSALIGTIIVVIIAS